VPPFSFAAEYRERRTFTNESENMKTSTTISPQSPKKIGAKKSMKSPRVAPSTLVATYTAAAQSIATTRSYDADIRHFKLHGGTIPATPAMVAEYLANFAGALAVATLQRRLIAIHRAHVDIKSPSPIMDPIVKRIMQGIRRTFGTKQRRVTALVKDDLVELMVHIEQQLPMKASRDKALLLIGFAGAFRRSELVGLEYADMIRYDTGLELLLRRSKTDQEGAGRTVFIPYARGNRCPVKALLNWLELAGIVAGALFRPINRHDQIVGSKALTPQAVALIVKSSVRMMAGDVAAEMVAGHSLRAGYCTEAATVGLQPYQIREQTGHKSDLTLARYIRPVAQRKIPSLL
jgi:integrase